ncbi:MAG: oligosaccharide flippase family protein [Prevotella sp.]
MAQQTASYRHIFRSTSLFGGVQGLNVLIGIVRNKCVAVILGPSGMGLLSLYNATVKLMSDTTSMGIAMSGVKTMSARYEEGDEGKLADAVCLIRSWSVVAAIMGMLLCMIAAPVLSAYTFGGGYTWQLMLLSPTVALMALIGGELAVLKALRRLKSIARVSVWHMVGALITSVPILYVFGEAGIVPSIVIAAAVQMGLVAFCAHRAWPWRVSLRLSFLRRGMGMVRLGVAFVAAGIMGSGMEFAIRAYLGNAGGMEMLGLYNAGYMMTMTYGGMIFAAMETDYFPRLSAIGKTGEEMNRCVNRQIEVSLLMISPLLVALMVGLPVLLPLLFTGEFLPVADMMRFSILALYLRALSLPVAYIPLGQGAACSYLLMEAVYDLSLLPLMMMCYHSWGLVGTGIALCMAAVLYIMVLLGYTKNCYGYRPSGKALCLLCIQMPIGIAAFGCAVCCDGWKYWVGGCVLVMVSLAYTLWSLLVRTKADENTDVL